jgi:hypothetical protein
LPFKANCWDTRTFLWEQLDFFYESNLNLVFRFCNAFFCFGRLCSKMCAQWSNFDRQTFNSF